MPCSDIMQCCEHNIYLVTRVAGYNTVYMFTSDAAFVRLTAPRSTGAFRSPRETSEGNRSVPSRSRSPAPTRAQRGARAPPPHCTCTRPSRSRSPSATAAQRGAHLSPSPCTCTRRPTRSRSPAPTAAQQGIRPPPPECTCPRPSRSRWRAPNATPRDAHFSPHQCTPCPRPSRSRHYVFSVKPNVHQKSSTTRRRHCVNRF
jgi:hypothetical protein